MGKSGRQNNATAKGPSQRQLRIGEMLRHTLADILTRGDIRDDDLKGAIITVSEVRISPDARSATAFVMPLGGRDQEKIVAALNRHTKFLRGELGHAITMKFTPTISFRIDASFEESDRINRVLNAPEVRRDIVAKPAEENAEVGETGGADHDDTSGDPSGAPSGGPPGGPPGDES